ncbi:MAG: hypothetical protein R2733_19405 [Acidimicrobiales bacterium]
MMTTEGKLLLAELEDDTARAWEAYANANGVTVEALLDALGPVLRRVGSDSLDLRQVLRQAVDAAR